MKYLLIILTLAIFSCNPYKKILKDTNISIANKDRLAIKCKTEFPQKEHTDSFVTVEIVNTIDTTKLAAFRKEIEILKNTKCPELEELSDPMPYLIIDTFIKTITTKVTKTVVDSVGNYEKQRIITELGNNNQQLQIKLEEAIKKNDILKSDKKSLWLYLSIVSLLLLLAIYVKLKPGL